jgi:hypothetical protein
MRTVGSFVAATLIVALAAPAALAQDVSTADAWRAFAEKTDVGSELNVRLDNGQRFKATLIGARTSDVLLQPKGRVPLRVQPVPYESIASLERQAHRGMGAGKAAAIGVATGVGAFFGTMLILFAVIDD